ncbi:OLC1v1011685C1 [Oldenlandia corymbosa var. corymbosa]|uniref:OLC1v1011685C1 n=1 Tax=Oldenlandia corymbosa var. corymbosa TaxID=529605 RepID=A0AAV1DUF0_OLDCO|nr:OLC1v1011685C1 [Oldenlandia corymbosa var. corymbosa]
MSKFTRLISRTAMARLRDPSNYSSSAAIHTRGIFSPPTAAAPEEEQGIVNKRNPIFLGVGAIGGRNHSTVAAEFSSGVRPWTRPLSPHLPVYKPQSNSTSSIFNRIAGVYLTAVVLAPYFLCMKVGTVAFTYDYVYQLFFYSSKLVPISAEIAALALGYHVYKGIGHLVADASGKVGKVKRH